VLNACEWPEPAPPPRPPGVDPPRTFFVGSPMAPISGMCPPPGSLSRIQLIALMNGFSTFCVMKFSAVTNDPVTASHTPDRPLATVRNALTTAPAMASHSFAAVPANDPHAAPSQSRR
jgi:hypothetical protein